MSGVRANKRWTILVSCFAIIAGGYLIARHPVMWETKAAAEAAGTQQTVPTAEFIAAAMKNQALANIEVKYSSGSGHYKYHYIRTPDALSMTQTYSHKSDVMRSSYDFAAKETKVLESKGDGMRAGTVQTPWLGDPFVGQDLLDPVMFVLPWGAGGPRPLYEWIASGVVLSEQEEIDGHLCWRVDMIQPRSHVERYSIWVDPDVGFSPRRIEIVSTDEGKGPTVIDFKEYRELVPGIWYPMKNVNEFSTVLLPEGTNSLTLYVEGESPSITDTAPITWTRETTTRTASEASAGKSFAKSSLLVEFPSGTQVFVNNSSEPITAP